MFTLSTSMEHCTEVPACTTRKEKETKGVQTEKEDVKLFVDGMSLHVKNPKESTQKTTTNKRIQQGVRIQDQ